MIQIGGCKKIENVEQTIKMAKNFSKENGITVQLMDADLIYGKDHLISSIMHAQRAFEESRNSSDSLAIEILLYASGKRQIKDAIKFIGIKEGKPAAIIMVTEGREIPKNAIDELLRGLGLERDDSVIKNKNDKILKEFGISNEEIEATNSPKDLILEKVAMVDLIKE